MAYKKVKLGDICQINPQTGKLPESFIYIDLESVVAGELLIEKHISKNNAPSRAQRVLSDGDILYQTVRPYQKNNYFFEKKNDLSYVASTGYAQIKTSQDKKFLYHYLHKEEFTNKVLARCAGTSYPAIAPSELAKIIITIPTDIAEQKRIAKILSTCDEVIFNTQKVIKKYKAVKQGLMQDLFTRGLTEDGKLRPTYKEAPELYKQSELGIIPKDWEVKSIESLAEYMTDGPFGSDLKTCHYTDKKEARIIQLSNVGEDGWVDENVKYTTFSHAQELSRCIVRPGDVIIAKMMPAGRAIICPNHESMFIQGSDVVKFVPNKLIDSKFFVYMTKQKDYLAQIDKNTQGSTRARTSISKLKSMHLGIPIDIIEQKRIANILLKIDSIIQKEEAILSKYRKIKTGLMDKLLTN